ncbi:hypothetical protein J6590_105723, partial [Homalodisca vitripennis]
YAYMETPVLQLEQRFNLQSLYHRRIIFDLLFLFRLINGLVDCPALLEMVDLSVPRGTRSRTVFCRKFLPTNYACNSGVARILRHGGVWSRQVDFFPAHGSSDTSFERAHLVELNAANRISKGLSNQKWRVVLGTHCEVHYALPFLTGSSYSDAVRGVSLY